MTSEITTALLGTSAKQAALSQDREILASKSLSLEKSQISLATLIMALFYDLATEKDFKIPTQPERRERALRDLIKKRQKPIALFIDDAHDLHGGCAQDED